MILSKFLKLDGLANTGRYKVLSIVSNKFLNLHRTESKNWFFSLKNALEKASKMTERKTQF